MTVDGLPDIQDSFDDRDVAIEAVGITGVRYPITFVDGELEQAGMADFSMTVALPAERRGTHMSRMIELIDQHLTTLDPRDFPRALKYCQSRLDSEAVTVSAAFPIAIETVAPVSQRTGMQVHDVEIQGSLVSGSATVRTAVTTDITSLCPCSKAISDYGAHNQRSRVQVTVIGELGPYPMSVTSLVELIRGVGSAPVYPVVKRPDERQITMQAFDRPAFVEDIVRDVSVTLRRSGLSHWVQARNIESIHSHDAVARVQWNSK